MFDTAAQPLAAGVSHPQLRFSNERESRVLFMSTSHRHADGEFTVTCEDPSSLRWRSSPRSSYRSARKRWTDVIEDWWIDTTHICQKAHPVSFWSGASYFQHIAQLSHLSACWWILLLSCCSTGCCLLWKTFICTLKTWWRSVKVY